jgi:hypothetical protein
VAKGDMVMRQLYRDTVNEYGYGGGRWSEQPKTEILALLLSAAENNPSLREELVKAESIPLKSYVVRRKPTIPFREYFRGQGGTHVLSVLDKLEIHTREELRLSTESSGVIRLQLDLKPAPDLNDRVVDGIEDRRLRMLYEAGAYLPSACLARLHAVYEWAIANKDARDTDVATWKPWLQPGRRVTVKMSRAFHGNIRYTEPINMRYEEVHWIAGSTNYHDANRRLISHVLLKGTVISYQPQRRAVSTAPLRSSSSSSSSSSLLATQTAPFNSDETAPLNSHETAPFNSDDMPSCVVRLDRDQFRWLMSNPHPTDEQLLLEFVSKSQDAIKDVGLYMETRRDCWYESADPLFAPVSWNVKNAEDVVLVLSGGKPGMTETHGMCIQTPSDMIYKCVSALAHRGDRISVLRHVILHEATTEVEARVLRATHDDDGKVDGMQVWVDGHVVILSLIAHSDTADIEYLVGRYKESSGTRVAWTITYKAHLVGSLRAQIQRLHKDLPAMLDNYAPLADLVADMLL